MHTLLSKFFKGKWASFKPDNRGNFIMIAAIAFPIVIFTIGSAIDYANFRLASRSVQSALDQAGFAATRAITVEDLTVEQAADIAREQLMLNIANVSFIDVQAIGDSLRLDQNVGAGTLTAIADVQTPTLFAAIFGHDNISATLEATNQIQSLEISFVLDNTGSMNNSIAGANDGSGERIDALREAMENAIDLLLPAAQVNDNRVRASIVPYSDGVNLGAFYEAAVGPDAPDLGSNCVTEREGVNVVSDLEPNINQEVTLYETDIALTSDRCVRATLLPLTDDRDELLESVNNLETRGFTAGHNGITWGINTLSGNWQSFWPDEARPAQYLTSNVRKILVVMTDGQFNTSYFDDDVATGDNRNTSDAIDSSNELTREFCDLAKDPSRGVVVYTVTLGSNGAAQNLMAECATSSETAIVATSAEALDEAFEQIVIEARTPLLTK